MEFNRYDILELEKLIRNYENLKEKYEKLENGYEKLEQDYKEYISKDISKLIEGKKGSFIDKIKGILKQNT